MNLSDLVKLWIEDQGLKDTWKVRIHDTGEGQIYYRPFSRYVVWIGLDTIEFVDVAHELTVHMADPNLFPLLSNRLASMAKGFEKAKDSRKEGWALEGVEFPPDFFNPPESTDP